MDIKRGRPPKAEGAKRSAIAVRTTEETKSRIIRAAEAAGRSLTQEIEQKLELALSLEDEFGGPDGIALHRRIAWAIKRAENLLGGPWTDSPLAFQVALGAIEGALQDLEPPYTGETGKLMNRLILAKEQAWNDYRASYAELKGRFPVQTEPNAFMGHYPSFVSETVADYRYSDVLTDEELSDTVAGMDAPDESLIRKHQANVRAFRLAESEWKSESGALIKQEKDVRQRVTNAVRDERGHITKNLPATRT